MEESLYTVIDLIVGKNSEVTDNTHDELCRQLSTGVHHYQKKKVTYLMYAFRDLYCQQIDISQIDEFIDNYFPCEKINSI